MRRGWAIIAVLFGVGLLAVTVYVTVDGISHPSTRSSVAIALLGSIGVPIGLGALAAARRCAKGPNASELRVEAEARRRAASALDDAEAAETIKAEMDAYVALRARRLEIDRRREELTSAADAVVQLHEELKAAEAQLGLEMTELDPKTVETLGQLIAPRPKVTLPDFYVMGMPISRFAQAGAEWMLRTLERRRLQRLAPLAPDALEGTDKNGNRSGSSAAEHTAGTVQESVGRPS